ncbi:MAG: protein translocase subunit SecF [Actinobacteria bacterium]|nr:protein translocase subunit SecF [Actinomycetota bacterium]
MNLARRLYWGTTHFDFVGRRRRWFMLSAALMVVSALALGIRGLNLSVDFIGGSVIQGKNPAEASLSEIRGALGRLGLAGAKVQITEAAGEKGFRVQTGELTPDLEDRMVAAVAAVVGIDDLDEISRQTVGPTFGRQVTEAAMRALVVFLILVSLYMWWRLEWKMALLALVGLGHDLLLAAGIYALVGFEVTPATVIALLTILGYSLFDTVVVFDKIRENISERSDRQTLSAIVNMSVNQVLMRSINTSFTSLLPIGSLLFIGSALLGATTLREFALALFIGVAAGTYSSIFLCAELLAVWKEREEHWQRIRRRLGRKGVEDEYAAREPEIIPEPEAAAALPAATGAVPRPPRKRRRHR